VSLTTAQWQLEQKAFWRNRASSRFQFLLPIVFVLIFGGLFQGNSPVGGIKYTTYFIAGMVGVSVLATGFNTQSITLTFQRDQLLLKRLRGTPLAPPQLFSAKILSSATVAAIQIAIILVLGKALYGIDPPRNWIAFLVAIAFGVLVFCAIGIAYTAFIPNADAAVPMVQLPYLLMQFVSGLFIPFQVMPKWLQVVANLLPLRWFMDMVRAAYLGTNYMGFTHDEHFRPTHVSGLQALTSQWPAYLVLGVWGVASVVVALRMFRWENRR
jgi:ABC-2 type transport system permease protein